MLLNLHTTDMTPPVQIFLIKPIFEVGRRIAQKHVSAKFHPNQSIRSKLIVTQTTDGQTDNMGAKALSSAKTHKIN